MPEETLHECDGCEERIVASSGQLLVKHRWKCFSGTNRRTKEKWELLLCTDCQRKSGLPVPAK